MPRERKLPEGMQKRGTVYYSAFRAGGRLVRKRLSSDFKTACLLLRDLRSRADKAEFDLVDNDLSITDLQRQYLRHVDQTLRPATGERYRQNLANILGKIKSTRVNQVTTDVVLTYRRDRLAEGMTPRTVNMEVGALSTMLNWGVDHGLLGSNPLKEIKPLPHDQKAKNRRSLSVEEVQELFDKSPEYLKPVWRCFMTTGIRKNELANMLFTDVDFQQKTVVVRNTTAKNHKAREIPLDDEMLATITKLRDEAPHRVPITKGPPAVVAKAAANFSRQHVFVTGANTPWKNNLLRAFYQCCEKAGIGDATQHGAVDIHSLRVSFTTLAIDHGASPKAIQSMLGHSTLGMTMSIYAKATDRSKRDAVGCLPFAKTTPPEGIVALPTVRKVCASPKDESQSKKSKGLA